MTDSAETGRRQFLQIMGATVAIPTLEACTRQPSERIVPYVREPELTPGKPLFYASATLREGLARGVLVETHLGRPTKVEGNPEHPQSLGSTDAITQAETLRLYDPERSSTVLHQGAISSWSELLDALRAAMGPRRQAKGAGLCLLTGATTSPTLRGQIDALVEELPDARWYVHEPLMTDVEAEAAEAVFGERLVGLPHLEEATVVLSLDADPMTEAPPRATRGWAEARRRPIDGGAEPIRAYAAECSPTLFGAVADHRISLTPTALERLASHLAGRLGVLPGGGERPPGVPAEWIDAVVADLKAAGERALVLAGPYQPRSVHEIAHRINAALGAAGKTVRYVTPVDRGERAEDLAALHRRLMEGEVPLLVIIDTNPVYSAPGDIDFATSMAKAGIRFHLGPDLDETAERCEWHAPLAHPFEVWGDALAVDGTASVIQPVIEPLHNGRAPTELVAALADHPEAAPYDVVRGTWKERLGEQEFERQWRRVLHLGFQRGSERPEKDVTAQAPGKLSKTSEGGGLELVIRPGAYLRDGRYAGNAWLQELPHPLTKLTWDNVALVGPGLAAERGLEDGDVVRLTRGPASIEAPVWVMPGHPDGAVTVHLGHGRKRAGLGSGVGYSAYRLQTQQQRWHASGLNLTPLGREHQLATTQEHQRMEGRDLVRHAPIAAYLDDPSVLSHGHHKSQGLYPDWEYDGYAWGMTIDLTTCVGCNACVVACQAENNIPVVGKEEVARGRAMHWLRVDRYFVGPADNPTTHFQPVPCMHCEKAPCEAVCPVAATVHHDEGLNDMVYNRCVGTRYCSNNCPYKVRRFNYFGYSTEGAGPLDGKDPLIALSRNPDVTVRTRGVMEKCTYCVQRINYARVSSKKDGRTIRDGEIMTACQAACPAQAIHFGDINDPGTAVAARKAEPRNYGILTELNTEPRTTYLAKLTHPNTTLAPKSDSHHEGSEG